MNLKHLFYKSYFEKIDLRKLKDHQEYISEKNEVEIQKSNKALLEPVNIVFPDFYGAIYTQYGGGEIFPFELKTTYPGLILGTGYAHETGNKGEIKLGLHFDHTYGLPVLPGSSIKGALRSVFPGFKDANLALLPGSAEQESRAKFIERLLQEVWPTSADDQQLRRWVHQLELALFENVDILASKEKGEQQYLPKAARAIFFDAHISNGAEGSTILGMDSLTPHGDNPLKNPIPLPFLKVLPEVFFFFVFRLKSVNLLGITIEGKRIEKLFKKILTTIGVGAKTNVGYGQLVDPLEPLDDVASI